MMKNSINVRGARTHNLKNINLVFPKNKLVCFTGVSGSGKSSLAFDTIYAEGQRRYVESLSTYARQFLGIMQKPDVDAIDGLSPAISIDQKTTSRNPRSTVGTVTEVYDYLRLLFARVGHPHCPICGREISSQSLDQIVDGMMGKIKNQGKVAKFFILAPLVLSRKGEFTALFENLKAKGYKYVRIDGHVKNLEEDFLLLKNNKHTIEAVIDKISFETKILKDTLTQKSMRGRIADSVSQGLKLTEGLIKLAFVKDKTFEVPEFPKKFEDHLYSENFACPVDNIQLPEIEPRTFSFNSPYGACEACNGLGKNLRATVDLIFSNELTIMEGGILPFSNMFENETWYSRLILVVCEKEGIDVKKPIKSLTAEERKVLLDGTGNTMYKVYGKNRFGRTTYIFEKFMGVAGEIERRYRETTSEYVRGELAKYMREVLCEKCRGARLKPEALSVTVNKMSIYDVTLLSISEARAWIDVLVKNVLSDREKNIAKMIVREISTRLKFLESVGLEYLTLGRAAGTLSGGEAQRIRLASQIGSGLSGVLYVLDEPTIGLHQRDNNRLIGTLETLRDLGNTIVIVEHDEEVMKASDYIVDFGPGAGKFGGVVVAAGTPAQLIKSKKSLTGKYLSGKKKVSAGLAGLNLHFENNNSLTISGCSQFNLKDIDVSIPLGKLVCITGVSGSGKSTLLVETIYPAIKRHFNPHSRLPVGKYKEISGIEEIDKVILIDQSPIGRTPRSNPATYTKVFDEIRNVFALTREARTAGFPKGRFSFNVKGGRCEACEGQGQNKIEMQFMSDLWITCEVCRGKRYNSQTLEINYRGKNISEVLGLTISEAKEFFHAHPKIMRIVETLDDVGLGYMELGQPATTLSGGEAQRVKLASELAKRSTGKTLYILDEPTTGLHFADLEKLLKVLKLLVQKGNTVVIIEHNLDVIRNSDWIIDLGPEGGDKGGEIVVEGKVADIARAKKSYTAKYLNS